MFCVCVLCLLTHASHQLRALVGLLVTRLLRANKGDCTAQHKGNEESTSHGCK